MLGHLRNISHERVYASGIARAACPRSLPMKKCRPAHSPAHPGSCTHCMRCAHARGMRKVMQAALRKPPPTSTASAAASSPGGPLPRARTHIHAPTRNGIQRWTNTPIATRTHICAEHTRARAHTHIHTHTHSTCTHTHTHTAHAHTHTHADARARAHTPRVHRRDVIDAIHINTFCAPFLHATIGAAGSCTAVLQGTHMCSIGTLGVL